MKGSKCDKKQIYCMYCGNSSSEGPKPNQLLLNLLWEQYIIKYGIELLSTRNIMPRTLSNDIECRAIHIKSLIRTLEGKLTDDISESQLIQSTIEGADTLVKELENINKLILKGSSPIDMNKLNEYLQEYVNLLTGDVKNNRKGEYFIIICEQLLYYIQEAEFKKDFPVLHRKMNEWECSLGTDDHFQPKIIDVFRACEGDLGLHIIPSIPCRVGFIGQLSVGKTSLSNQLREIKDDDIQNETMKDKILVSPMRVGKSTYCPLEFEHEFDNGRKIILVDIEGSTDTDSQLKSGNYFDEIRKADCDLYILVFGDQYTDTQRAWHDYIVNDLHRACWLVRNKVDELFLQTFKENVGEDFDSSEDVTKNEWVGKVIQLIRQTVSVDIHGNQLSKVYLTFTSYDKNCRNKNLSTMPFSLFDLEELKNDIRNLPKSLHGNRLQKMALGAMARVINNSFRRGYVINVMKYKIAAGIAAAIPFLDLIPRYYGREEIRQAFGVNTRSRFTSWITGKPNTFKNYLKEFDIAVDESSFTTSTFKKTFRKVKVNINHAGTHFTSAAIKTTMTVGIAGASVSDDVIRAVGVGAVSGARVASTCLIIVGAVLTVGMCAWAAVSNGQQLYNYLNRLCDDLIIVGDYVTKKIIEDNDKTRDSFSHQEQ